jgi:hypothetical protein
MRQQLSTDTVQRHIDAAPEDVYDIVADVTRTPELSPEVAHCEWIGGATGPVVGARFRARNSVGRGPDWHNKPVVTVADRGRQFVFERTEPFAGTVQWGYRFEPERGGTRVTEWYRVTRNLTIVGWFVIGGIYGLKDRAADLRRGMVQTLERLAAIAESARGTTGARSPGQVS